MNRNINYQDNNFLFLESSSNILIECDTNTECNSVIKDTTCSQAYGGGYCQCPAGYTFSSDVTKCLKG